MPNRVPRTHDHGTKTQAQFFGQLRSDLRKRWMMSKVRAEAKRRARATRGWYVCALCRGPIKHDQIQVDHIVPCGSLRDYPDIEGFVRRLWCDIDGLRVLCKPCHERETHADS